MAIREMPAEGMSIGGDAPTHPTASIFWKQQALM
jgi:hypothetical protein